MRIHYILHADFEELGVIQQWLDDHHHQVSATHTYKHERLPFIDAFDMLILMGGPQSVLELEKYPYLRAEVALIKQAIAANKVILGICLGAQLIGEALGAKAMRSPHKEIGVYEVMQTEAAKTDPLFKQFPPSFEVMHWHEDMPGLAPGSVLLAKSAGCPRQAFRYGDRIYAFQFHLELTPELIEQMALHAADDMQAATYVKPMHALLQEELASINQKMRLTLDYLAAVAEPV